MTFETLLSIKDDEAGSPHLCKDKPIPDSSPVLFDASIDWDIDKEEPRVLFISLQIFLRLLNMVLVDHLKIHIKYSIFYIVFNERMMVLGICA